MKKLLFFILCSVITSQAFALKVTFTYYNNKQIRSADGMEITTESNKGHLQAEIEVPWGDKRLLKISKNLVSGKMHILGYLPKVHAFGYQEKPQVLKTVTKKEIEQRIGIVYGRRKPSSHKNDKEKLQTQINNLAEDLTKVQHKITKNLINSKRAFLGKDLNRIKKNIEREKSLAEFTKKNYIEKIITILNSYGDFQKTMKDILDEDNNYKQTGQYSFTVDVN